VSIQISENCHQRVSPDQEAQAYGRFWDLLVRQGKNPTLASFAKRVGRSRSTVEAALLFVKLPPIIQHTVAGEWGVEVPNHELFSRNSLKLPYGVAVELARLSSKKKCSKDELIDLVAEAVVFGIKVDDFHKMVDGIINTEGQGSLELMTRAAIEVERKMHRRHTFEREVNRLLIGREQWFARVLVLLENGQFWKENLALGSIKESLIKIAALYEAIHNLVYKRPSPAARKRLAVVKELARELMTRQEEVA
jgi:hypothetical protein